MEQAEQQVERVCECVFMFVMSKNVYLCSKAKGVESKQILTQ